MNRSIPIIIIYLLLSLTLLPSLIIGFTGDDSEGWKMVHPGLGINTNLRNIITQKNLSKIYAFGDSYTYMSADTGKTWKQKGGLPGGANVKIVDDSIWYDCVYNTVFKTTDGGDTWNSVFSSSCQLYTIDFINSYTGIAVGTYGSIYRTADGGVKWDTIRRDTTNFGYTKLFNVKIINDSTVYAVGTVQADAFYYQGVHVVVIRSFDCGKTWENLTNSFPYDFLKPPFVIRDVQINCLTKDTIYLAVNAYPDCKMAKTKDGGMSWSTITTGKFYSIIKMHWYDEANAYLLDRNTDKYYKVWATKDSGSTWNELPISGLNGFQGMANSAAFFANNSGGLIVGNGGLILQLYKDSLTCNHQVFPNFIDLQFVDDSTGFVIGENTNLLYKTTNAGISWNIANRFDDTTVMINQVFFINKDTGIISSPSYSYYSKDGFLTWKRKVHNVKMDYTQPYTVPFYAKNGDFIIRNGIDSSWECRNINQTFRDLQPLSYSKVWAITFGYPENIIEVDSGIVTDTLFSFKTEDYFPYFNPHLIRYNDLVSILTTYENVYITYNNGKNWTIANIAQDSSAKFKNGYFVNDAEISVYGVGKGGWYLWKSADTGHTWKVDLNISDVHYPFMAHYITDKYIYLCGENGSVYRRCKFQTSVSIRNYSKDKLDKKLNTEIDIFNSEGIVRFNYISDKKIYIVDLHGRVIEFPVVRINKAQALIDLHRLTRGVYILKTSRFTKKICKY